MNYKDIYYMKKNAFIILAGGSGKRFKSNTPKQYAKIKNLNSIELILNEILNNKNIRHIIIVYNFKNIQILKKTLSKYKDKRIKIVKGGKTRQESSFQGLKYLKKIKPKNVLIHDGCRPYIKNNEINKMITIIDKYDCCCPLIKNVDLIRFKKGNKFLEDKKEIYQTQTPQIFKYNIIYKAHKDNHNKTYRDDTELLNNKKYRIKFLKGRKENIKITYKDDIKFYHDIISKKIKYGIGYDIHAFNFNKRKKLKLCGVKINYYSVLSHSDGDVGYHALCDSIFGALGIGDIGQIFKNNDKRWKNKNSDYFIKYAKKKIDEKKGIINNIDMNIICEKPKISLYSNKMKNNIAKNLGINKNQINIKATTNEKIGFIGKGKGIAAESIICISFL